MTQEELEKLKEAGADIKVRLVERIELIGPMDRANEMRRVLYEGNFDVTSSGPYTDSTMFPRCDMTRYKYHAEREVTLEEGEKIS